MGIDPCLKEARNGLKNFLIKRKRFVIHQIFIGMIPKSHKIIARITESQLRWLTDVLIQEQRNKSQILREALNQYLVEKNKRYKYDESSKPQTKTKK